MLRLTPREVEQLVEMLDSEQEVVPQLRAFLRRVSESAEVTAR